MNVDYKWEIKNMFENYAVMNSEDTLVVRKVVLVYNIEDILVQEEKLLELVEEKKDILRKNEMDFKCAEVIKIDRTIEKIEVAMDRVKEMYIEEPRAPGECPHQSREVDELHQQGEDS
jgi:hypothetical protein